jgi:NADH-quinone oxidoreductase subunit C
MAKKALKALNKKFRKAVLETSSEHGDEVAVLARENLVEIATWLRDDPKMAFDAPVFCTAIDNLGEEPRFEVVYQLRSTTLRHRIRIKVRLEEDDVRCPSLTGIWPGLNWQERETYDMYGIEFGDHPDLRRIYLYDEFVGYPLRKDYPKEKRQPLVRRDDLPHQS